MITNKKDFYELWKDLSLGNRIQIFENVDEFLKSGFNKKVSIRYREAGSKYKAYYAPADKVLDQINSFVEDGADRNQFVLNESTPDDCLIIQGELQHIDIFGYGLSLTYSDKKCSMREAMMHPKVATGLKAKMILEYYANPKSYRMIQDLLETYPHHCIEFGIYKKNLGILPNHNVIIWECRNY